MNSHAIKLYLTNQKKEYNEALEKIVYKYEIKYNNIIEEKKCKNIRRKSISILENVLIRNVCWVKLSLKIALNSAINVWPT